MKFLKISGCLCIYLFWVVQSLFATTTIDQTLDVGAINGTHAVNLTGAFTYTIPIKIPEGTMGMQPNLSLNYNSQGGNGIAGYSWNLSGISAISRVNKNIYYDGAVSAPDLGINDALALDGSRILHKTNYNVDGITRRGYYSEMETFQRIYSKDQTSLKAFFVETKDGKTIEFGNSADSKLMTEDGLETLMWFINKVTDRNGNYMTYHYDTNLDKQVLLQRIEYTGNGTTTPYTKVYFTYLNRQDKTNAYIAGSKIENNKILDKIRIQTNNTHYKSYQLKYNFDHFNYLTGFQEWGAEITTNNEKKRLNSLTFEYGGSKASSAETLNFDTNNLFNGLPKTQTNTEKWVYIPGNFNGDGLQDFLGLKIEIDKRFPAPDLAIYRAASVFINDNKEGRSGYIEENISSKMVNEFHAMLHYLNAAGGGWFTYKEKSIQPLVGNIIHTGDINGDNIDDIVIQRQDLANFRYFESTGVGEYEFDINNNELNVRDKNIARLVDADGDGRLELFVLDTHDNPDLNYHQFYVTSFDERVNTHCTSYLPNQPIDLANWRLSTKDILGDGKTELELIQIDAASSTRSSFEFDLDAQSPCNRLKALTSETNPKYTPGLVITGVPSRFGSSRIDFNGDGKEDSFIDAAYKSSVETIINGESSTILVPTSSWDGSKELLCLDINSDGLSDFFMIENGKPDKVTFYINKGDGTEYELFTQSFTDDFFTNKSAFEDEEKLIQFVDIDGDGIIEVFMKHPDFAVPKIFRLNFSIENRLLKDIYDSYSNKTTVQYQYLSKEENYEFSPNQNYPFRTVSGPMLVVDKVNIPALTGTTRFDRTYSYENLNLHMEGKGSLGFAKVTEIDELNKTKTESNFQLNQTYALSLPEKTTKSLTTNGNTKISESISLYSFGNLTSPNRVWLRTDKTESIDFINKVKTVSENTDFDNFGNTLNTITKTYDYQNSNNPVLKHTQTLNTQFSNLYGWWIRYLPTSITSTLNNVGYPGTASKTINYTYHQNNGNLTSETFDFGTLNELKNEYSVFDKFGNPKSIKAIANGEVGKPERSSSYVFDNTGRFITKEYNDDNNLIKQAVINQTWGLPQSVTDIEGNVTSYTYDNYSRLITTTDYLENTTTVNRSWSASTNGQNTGYNIETLYKVSTTHPNAPESIGYFDKFGRNVLNSTEKFGNGVLYKFTKIDSKGRTTQESSSFEIGANKEKPTITTHTYDDLNRIKTTVTKQNFVNITSQINYSYATRVVNVTGTDVIDRTSTVDVMGNVVTVQDPSGYMHYSFNNFNELYKVTDTEGNTLVENEYDQFGRQTALIDINAGTTTYAYNAFDELISQTDAKNSITTFVYDNLGRTSSKKLTDANGVEINYTYSYNNATANGALMLNLETGPNGYNTSYAYDEKGRLANYTDNIDNKNLTTAYTYDTYSNIASITYPGDFTVDYEYDTTTGAFYKAKTGNTTLYEAKTTNHLGQITEYEYNNGNIPVTHTFNEIGMPSTTVANNSSGTSIFSYSYNFNKTNGNLNNRNDVKNNKTESFTYDALHRLTHVNNTEIIKYSFDGNIDYKKDAGDYTYDGPQGKINAVTGISNDDNTIPLLTECITYTAFDRPESITEGNKSYNLFYGSDHQRKKTVYTENGNTTTRYYSGNYELITTDGCSPSKYIYYLSFANSVDAIYYKEVPPPEACRTIDNVELVNEMYYVFTDYLGSILKVVDSSGNTKEEQSFDAWGRKRNANNWGAIDEPENAIPQNLTWLNRGYTSHEHLYQFGIINMNNRMYEPIVGRMLAADNEVSAPFSSQSYNRYSYAYNNPLKYTDPSGDVFIIPHIGFDMYGNISVGVTVGVGIPGNVASVSATLGHNFGSGNTYLSLGVGAGGFYANVGWGTQTGYTAGAGFGLSLESGFSTNLTSIGVGWSQNGGGHIYGAGFSYGSNGLSFNPSVSYGHSVNLEQVFGDMAYTLPEIMIVDKWVHGPTTRYLNYLQTGLDVIGLIPGFGEPADLINAAIYAARGQYGMMGMSVGAALPFAGWAFSGGKFASKGSSYIYRAVSKAELDDIAQFGLRTKSGGYETGKLFAPTAKEATQFGRNNFKFDKVPNTIMKVKVPNSILKNSYKFTADGMNAISIKTSHLSQLKATPLNFSVFK